MRPLSELIGRIYRVLVLLVVSTHCRRVAFKRMGRETVIDVVLCQWNVAGKLNVIVLVILAIIQSGWPGKTYGKLANLHIVNTKNLLLFAGTELKDREELANAVEAAEDDAGPNEGVGTASDGVSKLVTELDPVLVQPTTIDNSIAIKMSDVVGGEECGQGVAYKSANTVDSKDVECIVASKEVLQLGSIVARDAAADTEYNSGPGRDETGPWGNGYKACNHARAEPDSGPLALKTIVDKAPGDATGACSQVGDDSRHDGAEVSGQG
jgi:hypothetical protein